MLQVPYLPLAPSLWLTVPSLALLGSGSAAVVVASYTSCLQAALATPGHAETAATYSLGQLQHAPHPVTCHVIPWQCPAFTRRPTPWATSPDPPWPGSCIRR